MKDTSCGEDEGLEADTDTYRLINSIDVVFEPCEWPIPDVRVLEDEEGNPLAFVAICGFGRYPKKRIGLPTEFFNHQLLEVDYKDPYELAAFMGEYGFVGPTFYDYERMNMFCQAIEDLDVYDWQSITQFESRTGYMAYDRLSSTSLDHDMARDHYARLKPALLKLADRLASAQFDANLLTELKIRGLVSISRAQYRFEDWLYAAQHLKAMVQFKTPQELAEHLGESEFSVIRCCEGAVNIVQEQLKNVHPRLDILDVTEREYVTRCGGPRRGSYEEALAVQLWNFTLEAKEGYNICKECGHPFVHKQVKSRKTSSRSSSLFCCDKCKNRYSQREYRKSDGYHLKQQKEKR